MFARTRLCAAWVFNETGGSLFLITLLHAPVDASSRLLLPATSETYRAGLVILITRGKLAHLPPVKPTV